MSAALAAAILAVAAARAPAMAATATTTNSGDVVTPARLPAAPYTIKCFLDRDMIVNENLAARPVWRDGMWHGRSWSPDPHRPGPELIVQPGANASCIVRQNSE